MIGSITNTGSYTFDFLVDWTYNQFNGTTTVGNTSTGSGGDASLTVTAVPEPSTYGLLFLAAAGLGAQVIYRRRRSSSAANGSLSELRSLAASPKAQFSSGFDRSSTADL